MQEVQAEPVVEAKMVPMKLLRNYRPGGPVEIVGWHKPAVTRKDNTGRVIEISAAEFVKGEGGPPPYPGVGFPDKIWAGTVIKLTEDEARNVRRLRIAELEFAD